MRFLVALLPLLAVAAGKPFIEKEDIFPLEALHNHASSIVLLPNGNLLACWYRGSGERQADDVQVMGARKKKGASKWSAPFVLADQPGFPDTNPMLYVGRDKRLWLFWQTIVANQWETAITNYRVTSRWAGSGAPRWDRADIMLLKPRNILEKTKQWIAQYATVGNDPRIRRQLDHAADKYFARMGWMTRAHATELPNGRMLVGLYSDGYSFSLVAYSDDRGLTWQASEPIVGAGNIQPTFARRKDGTLVAYMRDNGPPPKRVQSATSKDNGETWTFAEDTEIPNPGSGLEVMVLQDGRWLMINNDIENNRYSLCLSLSDDEGQTWKHQRHIELDRRVKSPGSFHYPSIVQAPDGTIHATYSVFLNHLPEGQPRKTIRHAHFNLAWIEEGDPTP